MATLTVGERVRASIPAHMSQRALAPQVGMTHDALSRAINGQRHFSAVEVAKLAEVLDVDTHWLITGAQDPFSARVAARHLWGHGSAHQEESDGAIIARVIDAYRAAYAEAGGIPSTTEELPANASELRKLLIDAANISVRDLAAQVENILRVDVVRDPGLQTDYSLRIGDHAVLLLKSTVYWFRANWSIAHELGHLALGHHVGERTTKADEAPADAFASEFLMPETLIRDADWQSMTQSQLAIWLWESGVSTAALKRRLASLRIRPSGEVSMALDEATPKLLRRHVDLIREITTTQTHSDPIWERENATTGRQFPEEVVAALTERVESGQADPYLLAWVREVPVDDLSWPEPDLDAVSPERAAISNGAIETDWFQVNSHPA